MELTDKIQKNAEIIRELHESNPMAVFEEPIVDNIHHIRFGCDNQGLITYVGNPNQYKKETVDVSINGRALINRDFNSETHNVATLMFGDGGLLESIHPSEEAKSAVKGGFELYIKKLEE